MIVIIDKAKMDKYSKQYLSLIEKNIVCEIVDYQNIDNLEKYNQILVLEPMNEDFKNKMQEYFDKYPEKDIEGSYTDKLTITAEAILEILPKNLKAKPIMILNQSKVLGISLAHELIKRKASVISLNSTYPDSRRHFRFLKPFILISATGRKNFKLTKSYVEGIKIIIDISNDVVDIENKITSIPTMEVLKKRLKKL